MQHGDHLMRSQRNETPVPRGSSREPQPSRAAPGSASTCICSRLLLAPASPGAFPWGQPTSGHWLYPPGGRHTASRKVEGCWWPSRNQGQHLESLGLGRSATEDGRPTFLVPPG